MNQSSSSINLSDLLSILADACSRGCQVIQFVNHKRLQENNSTQQLNVQYKIANDPRSALTEADLNSQIVIVDCIRSVFGNELNIIGEEDEDEDVKEKQPESSSCENEENRGNVSQVFEKYSVDTVEKRAMDSSLFSKDFQQNDNVMVCIKDVTVYIDVSSFHHVLFSLRTYTYCFSTSLKSIMHHDPSSFSCSRFSHSPIFYQQPMDGTREFVEGRLNNVQCLIGITHKGIPIGGVIGLPFVSLDDKEDKDGINIVCALHSKKNQIVERVQYLHGKIHRHEEGARSWQSIEEHQDMNDANAATREEEAPLKIFTGDSTRVHKKHSLQYLEKMISESDSTHPMKVCIAGGCGNKILRLAAYASLSPTHHNAIAVMPPGTCSWDTAAPTAVLFAAMEKFGLKAKVTDMFGGELVYNASGKVVTNDLGVFVSCGEEALKYHEKLVKAMRCDAIILDSLLNKYWNDFGDCDGRDKDEEATRLKLKNAQTKEQYVHGTRNEKGYVLKCSDVQSLISDQTDLEGAKLIGYSMPCEKEGSLQLFWRKGTGNGEGIKEMPDEAVILREESGIKVSIT